MVQLHCLRHARSGARLLLNPERNYGLRLNRLTGYPHPILRRSRHLPLASTDGRLIENLNKTGVRLWTDSSANR